MCLIFYICVFAEKENHISFLKSLFQKYGNSQELSHESFELLLENLGLGNSIIKDHHLVDPSHNTEVNKNYSESLSNAESSESSNSKLFAVFLLSRI